MMPAGMYTFGVAASGKKMRPADPIEVQGGDNRLTTNYRSRSGLRTFGWVAFGVGTVTGIGLVIFSSREKCQDVGVGISPTKVCTTETDPGMLYGGLLLASLAPGGIALGLTRDRAEIYSGSMPPGETKTRRSAFIPSVAPMMSRTDRTLTPTGVHLGWQF
jgi:hypothetical protein